MPLTTDNAGALRSGSTRKQPAKAETRRVRVLRSFWWADTVKEVGDVFDLKVNDALSLAYVRKVEIVPDDEPGPPPAKDKPKRPTEAKDV
jgi:hypothetical protein